MLASRLSPHLPLPSPDGPSAPALSGEFLAPRDCVSLLHLMGSLASFRNDPRVWRLALLTGLIESLPAHAAAAFILKNVGAEGAPPAVASLFDAGFTLEAQRLAFLREFNLAPFRDPLSIAAIDRFITSRASTLTTLRSDVVDDPAWNSNLHVRTYRHPSGTDDCILSLHRGIERGSVFALLIFKPAIAPASEGSSAPGPDARSRNRFGPRDRLLVDTLHRGLDWLYKAEESGHRLNRSAGLTPRLRETLECLLAGHTERQAALKLALSVHTVHDYVKALYTHFGVSSRNELMSKWAQTGGQFPQKQSEP